MDRAVEDRAGQKGKYCDGGGSWFSTIFRADGSRNNSAHSASRSFDNKLKKLRESDHRSDRELIDEYDRLMDLEDLTDVVVVDELLAVINEIKGGSATRADIAGRGGRWPKYARSADTDGVLRLNARRKEIVLLRTAIERAYAKHGQLKQLLQEAQARPAAGLVQQGQPQSGSMPAVDDMVGHVRRWAGWIGEIKEGRTSPEGIASREGELWFALAFDEEGRLKPGNVSGCAGVVREMLGRLPPGCSDLIKVFEDSPLEGLIASGCEEAEGKKLDACEMLALTEEVRRGEITLVDAARAAKGAKGYSRIKRAFSHGGVFKAKGKDAGYILKKLDSNTANALIREAKAGTSRPLVRAAGALRNYTNWSRELMEGRITRPEIRRQEGGSPFCDAFDTHGKLDLTLDRNATRSALRRVDWAYEARPDLYDEFARTQGWKLKSEGGKLRELLDKGKEALADARPDLSEQSSVPRVPRINARRLGSQIVGLVQAILEIRAGSVALEDAERDFEGLSLLVDASGKFHDDKYLSGILETRLKPEQLNLGRKLIQDLRTLLPRADRFVGGASSAVGPGLDPAPETPSAHRVLRDFDLNEPWHEPQQADELVESSGVASVASRPVKPEMAEPAIGPRIPVLVEIPLDQARTAFREEVAQECDLTGDMVAWSSRLAEDAGLIVHHRMVYDPANDNEFPLRDPEDALHRVDRRYAGEDGKCHPNVKLKAIRMSRVGLDFLKALPARDPRVRMSDEEVGVVIGKLVADARDEFERLIEGRAASRPRCHARRLEAADLADHEGALKAQFGVFVRRPADPALYPTLSNGRILGFYMGALLRSEEERQRAWERHPGGEQYSIDADRASRRRGFGWSKGTRRTRVTFAGLGAANSVVFANTALRAPDPADPIPAYDRSRLNAIYLPFDLQLTDKSGRMQSEVAVALLALDNLFPEGDGRQELQVYADYGDAYLVNFTQQGLASEVEEVKEEAGVEVGAIVSNPGASGSAEDGSADESSRSCPPSV